MPYSNYYPCSVENCNGQRMGKGFCSKHYQKYKKYGNPLAGPGSGRETIHETCTIKDCNKKHVAQGMCQMHYRRNAIYGDPNAKPGRTRKNGKIINENGYAIIYEPEHPNSAINGFILEHRKVMSEHLGRPLRTEEHIHHKNGVRDDNRLENLEIWSTRQPPGQRIEDKVEHAIEILEQYAPHLLAVRNINGSH